MTVYLNDFNNNIQSYFISSTYGNETMVLNCLNHLSLVTDHRVFDVSVYGTNVFFINLHKLMSTGTKKMSLLWSAVSVLEVAAKSEETRQALIGKFHYLPTLANLLQETHNGEQQLRLLALVELLTHGARLESHEPYVESLIVKLLGLMEQGHSLKDKEELVTLALSVLVNMCYQNLPVTYLLTKNISISKFCGQIKQMGLIAVKMYIILERNDYLKEMDLHYMLKMSFMEVTNVLATSNSFILRHVVDYLQYIRQQDRGDPESSKENRPRNVQTLQDNFFQDNLKQFLVDIDKHCAEKFFSESESTTTAPTRKKRKGSEAESSGGTSPKSGAKDGCMDVLFEILACVVALEPVGENYRRKMVDLAVRWIRAKNSCARAVDLLRVILEQSMQQDEKSECAAKTAEACRGVLEDVLSLVLNNTDEKMTISFCKMLATIVKLQNGSQTVLDKTAERLFNHIFSHLLETQESSSAFNYSLPDSEIRMYIWALVTFNEFANCAPTHWFAKVTNLWKQKSIHFLIAKGLNCGDEEISEAVLQVTASVDFPRRELSHMISILSSSNRRNYKLPESQNTSTTFHSAPATGSFFNRDLLERMNLTVSHLQDAVSAGQINDVTKVELIEFYNCKIGMETQLMTELRASMTGMSTQISTLMHQNQLLSSEIDKIQRSNLPLVLKVSALETENHALERELNKMKLATASYDKKINQMKQEMSEYIKKYSEKSQQCASLIKEVEKYRVRDANYEKENKRLQHELTEMTKNRDDSRALLKAAEEDRQKLAEQKESERKLHESKLREREREISKRTSLVQQLEQQLTARDGQIESQQTELKELMKQLAAKDERIAKIEEELDESKNIQQAIYSLMNKGKK
ncbi:myosin-11 [Uranotaenia lowii]|uniref:myosin-11 n=1 Tax=Uranotaenia lowii TaxID=190385 RepID=UPI00247AE483|nr:myosin-11 [Uranotaenia lowii]